MRVVLEAVCLGLILVEQVILLLQVLLKEILVGMELKLLLLLILLQMLKQVLAGVVRGQQCEMLVNQVQHFQMRVLVVQV